MGAAFIRKLSKKQLVGLVYVGISIVMVGLAAVETQAQVQWFSDAGRLMPDVKQVVFRFDNSSTHGFALLTVSLDNPSSSRALTVSYVDYLLFVNSTSDPFTVQGSSEVAGSEASFGETIPAGGSLSLNANLTILPDSVSDLHTFLIIHPMTRRIFIQMTITLPSSFGPFGPEYCYEVPEQPISQCPPPRTITVRGGGG